jgi:hypothetical protein
VIALSTTIICITITACVWIITEQQKFIKVKSDALTQLETRIALLEKRNASEISLEEFQDLKTKVDTLRISQGLRVSR